MLFSIIIPVYNAQETLKSAVSSVLLQNEKDYEILLIDDKSTDNTVDLCLLLKERYDSIRLILNKENRGVAYTRNMGIINAKGEYIIFLDSDDELDDNILSIIKDRCIYKPDCIKFGYDEVIIAQNENRKVVTKRMPSEGILTKKKDMSGLIFDYFGYVWGGAYRRDFLYENKIYFNESKRIDEDTEFNATVFEKMKSVQCIEYIGYHYMLQNSSSLSHQDHLFSYRSLMEKFSLYRKMVLLTCDKTMECYAQLYWMYARFIYSFCVRINVSYLSFRTILIDLFKSKYFIEFEQISFQRQPIKRRIATLLLKTKNTFFIYCVIKIVKYIKDNFHHLFLYIKH